MLTLLCCFNDYANLQNLQTDVRDAYYTGNGDVFGVPDQMLSKDVRDSITRAPDAIGRKQTVMILSVCMCVYMCVYMCVCVGCCLQHTHTHTHRHLFYI